MQVARDRPPILAASGQAIQRSEKGGDQAPLGSTSKEMLIRWSVESKGTVRW